MAEHLGFIISGGRTGTQQLGDLLTDAIDDCWSEHEPDMLAGLSKLTFNRIRRFGLWHMTAGRALGKTGVRVAGTNFLTGKTTFKQTAERLRRQRSKYHHSTSHGLLIESYYAWWMVAPHLSKIFPHAKFVGIVRDPRTWISSWLSRDGTRDRGHWTHSLPPGPINAETTGDQMWAKKWNEIGAIGRLAWQWRLINNNIYNSQKSSGLLLFRFEDLFQDSYLEMERLCQHISNFPNHSYDIKDIRKLISEKRNTSKATGNEWNKWSLYEKHIVDELCSPLMKRLGYNPLLPN